MLLIVIEAPGKIQTVLKAAKQARRSNQVAVLATGGYLYVLNNKKVGVDSSTLKPIEEERTKNSYIFEKQLQEYTKRNKSNTSEIWVMTDPDREGEGIAQQVWSLCSTYLPDTPLRRAYTTELSIEGLQNIGFQKEPHQGIVQAHTARRVLDRLLPLSAAHAIHKPGDFEGLGRLQTAAVRVVKDKANTWKKYVMTGFWRNENKHFHVREYDENKERLEEKLTALKKNKPDRVSIRNLDVPAPPAHSALSLMVQLMDINPNEVMRILQKNYMAGTISYPRTDQRVLGPNATYTIANLIQSLHLNHLIKENWHKDLVYNQKHPAVDGAHPALHPTLKWQPTGTQSLTAEQRVQAEVAARALAQLLKPAKVEQTVATFMTDNGHWFEVAHNKILESGWSIAYERAGLQNPLTPKPSLGQKYPQIKEQLPTKSHIIEWMMDEKIGRPATLSTLPAKMQNQGLLSSACVTTRAADQQLKKLGTLMPAYTYAAFTPYMEKALETLMDHPEQYTAIVKNVLVQAGADVIGIAGMMQAADLYHNQFGATIPQNDVEDLSV